VRDEDIPLLVQFDAFHDDVLDTEHPTPYFGRAHAVLPC
jgi:hypothetical protein